MDQSENQETLEEKDQTVQKGGKCDRWHEVDRVLQSEIENAKAYFVDKLIEEGGSGRSFYSATKKLAAAAATPTWTINDMFVGSDAGAICDKILDYFGGIAGAGTGSITEENVQEGGLPYFSVDRTAGLLRSSKKT